MHLLQKIYAFLLKHRSLNINFEPLIIYTVKVFDIDQNLAYKNRVHLFSMNKLAEEILKIWCCISSEPQRENEVFYNFLRYKVFNLISNFLDKDTSQF
jgi:hypothetical protein